MKSKAGSPKPIEIKRGNVIVKIYTGKNRVNGVHYNQYTLVYYEGTQRRKRNFGDLEEAKREGVLCATKIASGEHEVLKLSSADRAIYLQAVAELRPLQIPLNVAVLEYTAAVKQLPKGASLKEAVEFFRRRSPANLVTRTVKQVVDEMLAAKRAAKLSKVHLSDLESRLGRFADAFQMNIGSVSGKLVQTWLDQMNLSGRTKRNNLHAVGALFRFAIKQKYLPKDALEEIESVQQAKLDDGEIEIFSPAEMRELLVTARPEMVPWLAIAGFAGLRSAELQRLDWSEVNLAERHIEISAKKAKTAARRLAPITDNLAAWLAPYAKVSGKVTSFDSWWNQLPKLVDEINQLRLKHKQAGKFLWKHNGLRHSFCSYRLASIQNAAQVALEAGNSPTIIFKSYRQLVTPAAASSWFAIFPVAASNVVPLNSQSAGVQSAGSARVTVC